MVRLSAETAQWGTRKSGDKVGFRALIRSNHINRLLPCHSILTAAPPGCSTGKKTHPRIHPKLRRLTRKYRCLGGIPCAVKLLKVKVRCSLTRKRSLVRIQSCLPYFGLLTAGHQHTRYAFDALALTLRPPKGFPRHSAYDQGERRQHDSQPSRLAGVRAFV
jgi:hypothetical protein